MYGGDKRRNWESGATLCKDLNNPRELGTRWIFQVSCKSKATPGWCARHRSGPAKGEGDHRHLGQGLCGWDTDRPTPGKTAPNLPPPHSPKPEHSLTSCSTTGRSQNTLSSQSLTKSQQRDLSFTSIFSKNLWMVSYSKLLDCMTSYIPKQKQNSDWVIHVVHTLKCLSGMVSVITQVTLWHSYYILINKHMFVCVCFHNQITYNLRINLAHDCCLLPQSYCFII